MRIAHVSVGALPVLHRYGGAVERRIVELARRQAARGHQVVVYSAGDAAQRQWFDGFEIRSVVCRGGPRLAPFALQLSAVRDLKREPADVIHFHNQPEGATTASLTRTPTFLSYDNFYFRRGALHPLYRRCLDRFDRLLPVSRYCLEESHGYWRFDSSRARILHNGVSIEQFHPDAAAGDALRDALGITKRHVILSVGRINRQKGSDVLIEGCRMLNQRRNDVQLVAAGPIGQFGGASADGHDWRAMIESVGGIYLGAVEEERLASVYNMATIVVMPTVALEMFGMVAVEAQACGKPVVASDHGGLRETVPTACGGRFRTGDPHDLAATIDALLDDRDAYDRAAANALANAARYDWAVINDQLETLYTETLR